MRKHILFQGDSITDGNRYKDPEQAWDLNHQIGHCYVFALNAYMGAVYPEQSLRFTNRGISGNRLVDVYARMEKDILALKPDIFSILVGVNDTCDQGSDLGTKPDKFRFLYERMLDEIRMELPEVQMVLMEPFMCLGDAPTKDQVHRQKQILEFAQIVQETALDYNTYFVPLQKKFDDAKEVQPAEYWVWDGVHPTENGHGLIALEWYQQTKDLFG